MKSPLGMKITRRLHRGLALAAAALASSLLPAVAQARCEIVFAPVAAPPTVDGSLADAAWAGATAVPAHSVCFGGSRIVEVKALQTANDLYVGFNVGDPTVSSTTANSGDFGDRVIVQFNGANPDALNLGNAGDSLRVNIGFPNAAVATQVEVSRTGSTTCGNGRPRYETVANSSVTSASALQAGGYAVEVRVPKSALAGFGQGRAAMSLIVVHEGPTGSSLDRATWFPVDMPPELVMANGDVVADAADPSGAPCDPNNPWFKPQLWGLAVGKPSPGNQVYIRQGSPAWISDDIDSVSCETGYTGLGDSYAYNPNRTCRVKVKARVWSEAPQDEKRDVLLLMSTSGVGGVDWAKVEFRQGVQINAGSNLTPTSLWVTSNSPPPLGAADGGFRPPASITASGHPCIKVVLLPTNDLATFPKARIAGQNGFSSAELNQMIADYGLNSGLHTAQQNISRDTMAPCRESCLAQLFAPEQFLAWFSDLTDTGLRGVGRLVEPLIGTAHAQPRDDRRDPEAREALPIQRRLFERYGRDHVIIDVHVSAAAAVAAQKGMYRIERPLGGVTRLVPGSLLRKQGAMPLHVDVAVPGRVAQELFVHHAMQAPRGMGGVVVRLPSERLTLKPGRTQTIKGTVVLKR